MTTLDVPVRFPNPLQWVGAIDDRPERSLLQQARDVHKVGGAFAGRGPDRDEPTAIGQHRLGAVA